MAEKAKPAERIKPAKISRILTPESYTWDLFMSQIRRDFWSVNGQYQPDKTPRYQRRLEKIQQENQSEKNIERTLLINQENPYLEAEVIKAGNVIGVKIKTNTKTFGEGTKCKINAFQLQYEPEAKEIIGEYNFFAPFEVHITESSLNKGVRKNSAHDYLFNEQGCAEHRYYIYGTGGVIAHDVVDKGHHKHLKIDELRSVFEKVREVYWERFKGNLEYHTFGSALHKILMLPRLLKTSPEISEDYITRLEQLAGKDILFFAFERTKLGEKRKALEEKADYCI
ncbi:MAG: hypothetical protein WC438_04900 [Candidatus Pacearchaeota archaeon]